METLKIRIKNLAAQQTATKNQRKTVSFSGERTMSASEAQWRAMSNKDQLRHLYLAYGMLRGMTVEQIESKSNTPFDLVRVNKLIEFHKDEFKFYEKAVCTSA